MELVIAADDFGVNAARTDGIVESFLRGDVTQVSLLVNGEDTTRAAEIARAHRMPIGLHFNLTEGRATASHEAVSAIVTEHSLFLGKVNFFRLTTELPTEQISRCAAAELRSQVAEFRSLLGLSHSTPVHIDGHHHVHVLPAVWNALEACVGELHIASLRLPHDRLWDDTVGVGSAERFVWSPEKCLGRPFWCCICRIAGELRNDSKMLSAGAVKTTDCFIGFEFSGAECTKKRLMEKLQCVLKLPIKSAELMTHVGHSYRCEPTNNFWHCPWSCSTDREHESSVYREVVPLLREMDEFRLCSFVQVNW